MLRAPTENSCSTLRNDHPNRPCPNHPTNSTVHPPSSATQRFVQSGFSHRLRDEKSLVYWQPALTCVGEIDRRTETRSYRGREHCAKQSLGEGDEM
jgi:hypothetical protein